MIQNIETKSTFKLFFFFFFFKTRLNCRQLFSHTFTKLNVDINNNKKCVHQGEITDIINTLYNNKCKTIFPIWLILNRNENKSRKDGMHNDTIKLRIKFTL